MTQMRTALARFARDERGHTEVAIVGPLAIAAAVLLAWGIVDEMDGLTIAGAAVAAVAIMAAFFSAHRWVVAILGRLDELERK